MLKEISLYTEKLIGKGKNADVYTYDTDKVAKVFNKGTLSEEEIAKEYKISLAAYELGVPTARCYELAKHESSLCIIYERINADEIRTLIKNDRGRIEELVGMAVKFLKKIQKLHPPKDFFPSMADIYHSRVDDARDLFTDTECRLMHELIDTIPERDTFLHGDFHRGNLLLRDGKLVLIDMADAAYGHPLYDVIGTYMLGPFILKVLPSGTALKLTGWDDETINKAWDTFKRKYFAQTDPESLDKIDNTVSFYATLRYMTFLHILPGFTDDMVRNAVLMARRSFFPFIEDRINEVKKEGIGIYGF